MAAFHFCVWSRNERIFLLVHCVLWTVLSAVAVLEPALHQIAVYSPIGMAVAERCPGCTAVDHAWNGSRGRSVGLHSFQHSLQLCAASLSDLSRLPYTGAEECAAVLCNLKRY